MKKCLYFVLVMIIVSVRAIAFADEFRQNVQSILDTRARSNIATLDETHKAAIIEDIRLIANSENQAVRVKALMTLVNMGATNAVNELMQDYNSAHPRYRIRLQRELVRHCAQPAIIPFLVVDLEKDEDVNLQFVGNEFFVEPRSVVASRIIRSIILKSVQFPESTKAWATRIDVSNAQTLRAEKRRWCRQNKAELLAHEFGKALPPTEGRE